MKPEEIRTLLEQSGADAWSITDEKRNGWEFYFIRHRLDQNRAVNTEHITVTVYRKSADGTKLGSASQEFAPTASSEEADRIIKSLLERALYVQNPLYELRKPAAGSHEFCIGQNDAAAAAGSDPAAISRDFISAMMSLPETETEDVNSYEIFANVIEKRLVTSTGIDITQKYPSSMLEVVTNARESASGGASDSRTGEGAKAKGFAAGGSRDSGDGKGEQEGREIELYRMYNSGTCDREELIRDISQTLRYGKDRLHTVPTPDVGKIPVVFSTGDSVQIYEYFAARMNAQQIYQKTSDWAIGKPVVDGTRGDRVTVAAKKFLPNSSRNIDYDEEGAPIRDMVLIRDGGAVHYWGNAMYSSLLGSGAESADSTSSGEDPAVHSGSDSANNGAPAFILNNYEVSGGSQNERQIRTGRYLEIVEFSDFQVDSVTGNIFGEIRLGYLHEPDPDHKGQDKVTIVSGGSVSGSMRDYAKNMYFSRETKQYDYAKVPAVTKLMDVTVTGAK